MLHSLYNTVRRTLDMSSDWLPEERQLNAALVDLEARIRPWISGPADSQDAQDLSRDAESALRDVASYIRVIHDLSPSPVSPQAVLSISRLIEDDLEMARRLNQEPA